MEDSQSAGQPDSLKDVNPFRGIKGLAEGPADTLSPPGDLGTSGDDDPNVPLTEEQKRALESYDAAEAAERELEKIREDFPPPAPFQRRAWIRHALSGSKCVLPWEDPEEYDLFSLSIVNEYRPSGMTELYSTQLAAVLWRLNRSRRLESVAYLLSPAARFANGAAIHGKPPLKVEDLDRPSPQGDGKTWGEVFQQDLDTLASRLQGFSRYEVRLWDQAKTLLKLLQPWERGRSQGRFNPHAAI